jgi:hypothetical protein
MPAKRYSIVARACTEVPASTIFALLKDGTTWPHWTVFSGFRLERPGRDEQFGAGAVRVFTTPVSKSREEIVELVPGQRLSYVLLSGLPLRNYHACVDLERAANNATTIVWRASFEPKYPGTGWFWRWFVGRVIQRCAEDLASSARNPRAIALLCTQAKTSR